MRESGFGTISSSPRLRREQMTSASSRLGIRSLRHQAVHVGVAHGDVDGCSRLSWSLPACCSKATASSSILMWKNIRMSHMVSRMPQIPNG